MIEVKDIGAPLRRDEFVKSQFSGEDPNGCLHVARRNGFILLWEDADPFEPAYITKVPGASISAFLKGAKAGEFDDLIQA